MDPETVVYQARKIVTMEPAMPEASAVAVRNGRILGVGSIESLAPWLERGPYRIDGSLEDKVVMPGLIDPLVHPSLPAVLTQFPFLAPDDWSLPTGEFPGALTPDAYRSRLRELVARHEDWSVPFIVWGYHPLWHGDVFRADLNEMFGDRPVILWHRSFHELILNDAALASLELTESDFAGSEVFNWELGHFWETGAMLLVGKLAPLLLRPDRYAQGMRNFLAMLQQAGVTSCMDMGVGIFGDPVGETTLIRKTAEAASANTRIVVTPWMVDFVKRGLSPDEALAQVEEWRQANSRRVFFDRRFKIHMDGAIFSGLSQMGAPGYLDGHEGVWMQPLDLIREWTEAFWRAGYQIHAHTNGDLSAQEMINILRHCQRVQQRVGHRFSLEHYAYSTEDQARELKELGAVVSANPYYQHILSDLYSEKWLGPDRGSQMVRLGSLERLGVPFALHSDCPMAPLSPLNLAWCATNRVTINGNLNCPEERVSLDRALRAITSDAAWIMGKEDDIGSIRAGKFADFAILDEDPYEVGAEGLNEIGVWGTLFEGELAQN